MRVYIAGAYTPYRGIKDGEPHIFTEEENVAVAREIYAEMTLAGIPAICPIVATHEIATKNNVDLSHEQWMRIDKELLRMCDYIFMLPNWEHSKGAQEEYNFATATSGRDDEIEIIDDMIKLKAIFYSEPAH